MLRRPMRCAERFGIEAKQRVPHGRRSCDVTSVSNPHSSNRRPAPRGEPELEQILILLQGPLALGSGRLPLRPQVALFALWKGPPLTFIDSCKGTSINLKGAYDKAALCRSPNRCSDSLSCINEKCCWLKLYRGLLYESLLSELKLLKGSNWSSPSYYPTS